MDQVASPEAFDPRPRAMASGQHEVVIELLELRDEPLVALLWQALEQREGAGGLACSWTWTSTWIRHFGDLVNARFAVGRRAGTVIGLALLTIGRGRWGGPLALRKLHVGTAGEPLTDTIWVEYNRVLAADADKSAFATALVNTAHALPNWDEFVLAGFAPEEAEPFLRVTSAFKVRRAASPTFDLRAARLAGGDALGSLKASTRQRIRRSLRGFGAVETEWAETAEHALAIFDDLVVLHQQRWTAAGKAGAFASPRFTAFHRDLIPQLMAEDAVILFRVRSAGGVVGCLYSFIEHENVLFYQGGLATFSDNKLKPGLVAHMLCMQHCIERGLNEYNFLAGEDRYKQELATFERHLIWATARRRTARTLLARGGEWGIRQAKHVRDRRLARTSRR